MTSRRKNAAHELASSLANNYACYALGPNRDHSSLLKAPSQPPYKRRVVVIVGSGASQDANLLGTKEILAKLKTRSFPLRQEVINQELKRLASVQRLDVNHFETQLLAMSATEHSGKMVRDTLVKLFSRKFIPTLTYELLAHLLKHKFVDAIISFNFDELLDQAISDELNSDEYHYILSDGDCPPSPLHGENEVLAKPFYIKPHGTVSHSSTLRFTRDDYYRLPLGIQRVMRELLTRRPVDLISIGFAMKSFEFNQILLESRRQNRIFYLNPVVPKPEPALPKRTESYPIQFRSHQLGNVLSEILDKTYAHFRDYRPRHADRHRLLARLFSDEKNCKADNPQYLWERTVVELALAIAKTKGFMTLSGLSSGRAGKYFRQYQSHAGRRQKDFKRLCKSLGLNDVAYGYDALRLSKRKRELIPRVLVLKQFEAALPVMLEKVRSHLGRERQKVFKSITSDVKQVLLDHFKGQEVEVRVAPEVIHDNIFKNPTLFRTKTALDAKTMELLQDERWRGLLLVSETGEWLTKPRVIAAINIAKHRTRCINMVVADKSHEPELKKAYGSHVNLEEMDWWDHNRHLTLFLNSRNRVMHSIYFTRRRRATDIVPVLLDKFDSLTVFELWKAYWIRSTHRGITVDRKQIEEFVLPSCGPNTSSSTHPSTS